MVGSVGRPCGIDPGASLGPRVIKIEPPQGDKTRSLRLAWAPSFFPLFNRGKRSVVLDFANAEDRETNAPAARLSADVFLRKEFSRRPA